MLGVPTEHEEQVQFLLMAQAVLKREQFSLLFAIPNGGARNIVVARKLKDEGVRRGVPDLMFAFPNKGKAGLFIEMKRRKGGRLSPEQEEYKKLLSKVGYEVCVCKGCDEAFTALTEYIA